MTGVSVVVITYNEEKNIERCLRSLQWCDDVIVVDSFSTDSTVDLARRYTESIIQHAYDGDIPQRERGFAVANHPWLMYIDADEEVSVELRDEILRTVGSADACDGYFVPRKVSVLGRWVMHGGWYPDYSLRLFRRDRYYAEAAEVHGGFNVRASKGYFHYHLYHYTYSSFEEYIRKMNDYTSLQVSEKIRDSHFQGPHLAKLLFSPLSHFLRKYISQRGYKDGMIGFFLAGFGAIYTLALYAKLWEYRMRAQEGRGLLPPVTNLQLRRVKRL